MISPIGPKLNIPEKLPDKKDKLPKKKDEKTETPTEKEEEIVDDVKLSERAKRAYTESTGEEPKE